MEGDRSATQMLRRNAGAEQSREDPLRDSHDTSTLAATSQSPVGKPLGQLGMSLCTSPATARMRHP
jgi:hypothetical protein